VGKLTIDLDDSVERIFRHFIGANYLKPHGKIKEVMEKAIADYCSLSSVSRFVESLDLGEHVLLVGEDAESARRVELEFIAKSLAKGYNTVVLEQGPQHGSAETIAEEARSAGVEFAFGAQTGLLHVLTVPEDSTYPDLEAIPAFGLIKKLKAPCAVLISSDLGSGTEKAFERRVSMDARIHDVFDIGTTVLCSYRASRDPRKKFTALGKLMQMHTSAVFTLVNRNLVLGQLDAASRVEPTTKSSVSAATQRSPGGSRVA
jgi:hypothetical protein